MPSKPAGREGHNTTLQSLELLLSSREPSNDSVSAHEFDISHSPASHSSLSGFIWGLNQAVTSRRNRDEPLRLTGVGGAERISLAIVENVEHASRIIQRDASNAFYFSSVMHESYLAFCDDFGPVDMVAVHNFCNLMEEIERAVPADRTLVYYCQKDERLAANAAFLLATYLVARCGWAPESACNALERAMPARSMPAFRDASFLPSSFDLTLYDCVSGVAKGVEIGWYKPETFAVDDFVACRDMIDMTEVVPGKFVAFRGPGRFNDACNAEAYARIFSELRIKDVVRLNDASTYDKTIFTKLGINVHELFFEDCSIPAQQVIKAFFDLVNKVKGTVAVHCLAGLGRTGTLIALWMMRYRAFSAREAIAWLRVMRPGSVIGSQQAFLEQCDGATYTESNIITLKAGNAQKVRLPAAAKPTTVAEAFSQAVLSRDNRARK